MTTQQSCASSSTGLRVERSKPAYHCPQAGGSHSIRLTNLMSDDVTMYLDGTPEELIAWAERVRVVAEGLLHDPREGVELQWVDTNVEPNVEPNRILTFDECAQLGLDGTGRTS